MENLSKLGKSKKELQEAEARTGRTAENPGG